MNVRKTKWIVTLVLACACASEGEPAETQTQASESSTDGEASTRAGESDAGSDEWSSSESEGEADAETDSGTEEESTGSESSETSETDGGPGMDDECNACAQAAVDPGGECHEVVLACVTDMAPDGCFALMNCMNGCVDETCVQGCIDAASEDAQLAFDAIGSCIVDACPECADH